MCRHGASNGSKHLTTRSARVVATAEGWRFTTRKSGNDVRRVSAEVDEPEEIPLRLATHDEERGGK